MVTNNFSPTHQAGEPQPSAFHSITSPHCPVFLLHTNKPITATATDINWTPFLKTLPQPFFFLSFFFALLYSAPISPPTRQTMHTRTRTHTRVPAHAYSWLYSVSRPSQTPCSLVQPGFICVYIPLIYYHVKCRLKITSVFWCIFFFLRLLFLRQPAPNLPLPLPPLGRLPDFSSDSALCSSRRY